MHRFFFQIWRRNVCQRSRCKLYHVGTAWTSRLQIQCNNERGLSLVASRCRLLKSLLLDPKWLYILVYITVRWFYSTANLEGNRAKKITEPTWDNNKFFFSFFLDSSALKLTYCSIIFRRTVGKHATESARRKSWGRERGKQCNGRKTREKFE